MIRINKYTPSFYNTHDKEQQKQGPSIEVTIEPRDIFIT